ncbi:MAG TPA: hypothetical protein VGD79_07030 [Thermoanaerobaculia bacterium]|jgi:hypothetical protein
MIYRKHGSVARWENGTLIRVTECGEALEDTDYFECRPLECGGNASAFESGGVASALQTIPFERLIITRGVAEHECEGRTWREETHRIHASLTHNKLRALIDVTNEQLGDLFAIANALRRVESEREITRVRLAPSVTAALLPHLIDRTPPNVRLVQTAGGVDGYGRDIVETDSGWPNVYRPSYRIRPVRMPLNLRLECDETHVDEDLPRAIALLAPVTGLTIRVLVEDARRVHPATITVDRIRAVSNDRVWYPYGGGSFGAAMML